MRAALQRATWDVILSDYSMPAFSAPAALELLTTTDQDVPFVIVSGTVGEESAVAALKAGAQDFARPPDFLAGLRLSQCRGRPIRIRLVPVVVTHRTILAHAVTGLVRPVARDWWPTDSSSRCLRPSVEREAGIPLAPVGQMSHAPKRCLLCHSDRVIVRKVSRRFIIACRGCGGTLAYTPRPPDDPALAGRIELLNAPSQSGRSHRKGIRPDAWFH